MAQCTVADCENKGRRRGLCDKHYVRLITHGDVRTNFRKRYNRVLVNDLSQYDEHYVSGYERQALREMFFRGKHHGGLSVNYDQCIDIS